MIYPLLQVEALPACSFCITKEQVKLMVTHRTDKIIGEVFVSKLINVLLYSVSRRSSQLTYFLVALTLRI